MRNSMWRKGFVVGTIFFLSFVCIIPFETNVMVQSSARNIDNMNNIKNIRTNIIIVPDDYPTIQAAINHSSDFDEIQVHAGIYKENIVVNKTVTIKGDGFSWTIIDGKGINDTVNITADGVTIFGFTIQNSAAGKAGINTSSNGNTIQMNKITGNGYGIVLEASNQNQILDNWIVGNTVMGLSLESSHFNNISGNKISKNGGNGCMVNFTSTFNVIAGNIAQGNGLLALSKGQNNGSICSGLLINAASRGNSVVGNGISNNVVGVKGMGASNSNIFQYNDLTENLNQNANDSSNNAWSKENKGNHWSDYTGKDSNSDGIGDTPYPIPGGSNKDNSPFMIPVIPNPPVISGNASVKAGKTVVFHINKTIPNYAEVYYEIYWGGNGGWERTPRIVNTTIGINQSHVFNIPQYIKNHTLTLTIIARTVVMVDGVPIYSDDSAPFPIKVPYSYNNPIQRFLELLFQRFPNAFPILRQLLGY